MRILLIIMTHNIQMINHVMEIFISKNQGWQTYRKQNLEESWNIWMWCLLVLDTGMERHHAA